MNAAYQSIPDALTIEFRRGNDWIPVAATLYKPVKLTGNTATTLRFEPIRTSQVRLNLSHEQKQVAITEIEYY
ncbi:hypothetical protein WBJ53_22330 [Spirosoma sp. SC4-14]|uniref:hypothetical protein n=1 Tax=Spirosoma sp. SC4-14 TaxID=3128900 RepID=UPI0030CCE154